jgi:NADH-quinone oxidoreductase subunit M
MLIVFSGLPGTGNFIGEFLTILGAFRVNIPWGVFAALGVILSAIYMLWMFQRVMQGEADKPENRVLLDLTGREISILVPLALLIFFTGIYPKPLTDIMHPSVTRLIDRIENRGEPKEPAIALRSDGKILVQSSAYIGKPGD